jgi:MFS family permease
MNPAAGARRHQAATDGRVSGTRWRVLAWLCSLSALTYIGRVAIIQVQERMELDLHLTPARMAYAFAAFSLAYALFEVPTGWFGDKLGPRAGQPPSISGIVIRVRLPAS